MMLLEDSPAVLSLGLLCEKMGYFYELTNGESPSLMKYGKVPRCNSENHVPSVGVSEEPRKPDVSAKALGDRLRIPSARALGDRSRQVPQSGVSRQENPGKASGDRLHFVQAPEEQSRKFPEWRKLFEAGLSGEPLRLTESLGGRT